MHSYPGMKLAQLKKIPPGEPATSAAGSGMRGTDAQDSPRSVPLTIWRRHRVALGLAAAAIVLLLGALAINGWLGTGEVVAGERLRIARVSRGHFVRDVAAEGTVVAAVSPTLFAIAPGTVSYAVRAGDAVHKGEVLAALESPELTNELQREQATLGSLDAALARQQIEIRRQMLTSQQHADLAQVAIDAAERELKRSQWAWDQRVISERDYTRAIDEVKTSKLNFDHARDTAALERDSLALELRTRRLERDRQALTVAGLTARVAELNVRSPVDGTVANLAQPQRTRVAANAPLLTVVDLSAFEIEFQVAEVYARDIRPGMPAEVTVEGRTVPGTVTAVSPEVRQNQVTGRVKFRGPQPPGLRQNERTGVRIVLDEREGVLKFERGPFIDENTHALYVVRGSHALRTPVLLGAASVSEIEVVRGLVAGDEVVTSDMRDAGRAARITIAH
ncbi:MAG: HlyD family efflux transporter periplasmic adaptor subunit [Gammaproteobacteria bacterium]|nr:HlyD family efflux transporter periplasmic adaptor subunit [Gammaproteobacteria bacterium]MBV9725423.1 HlyD family efflux transporter periplasmic adaptor subunit [Gammaproteobacteria bacterium]